MPSNFGITLRRDNDLQEEVEEEFTKGLYTTGGGEEEDGSPTPKNRFPGFGELKTYYMLEDLGCLDIEEDMVAHAEEVELVGMGHTLVWVE